MGSTFVSSKKYSPGPARLAPGVRATGCAAAFAIGLLHVSGLSPFRSTVHTRTTDWQCNRRPGHRRGLVRNSVAKDGVDRIFNIRTGLPPLSWWKFGAVYQIDPRSFRRSIATASASRARFTAGPPEA